MYFDSVTMFIFLLSGSRYLEMRARHYRNSFSSDFFSLLPSVAIKVAADGTQQLIPLEQLQCGDIAWVRSGEVLPADGYLLDDHCRINEAALTGEYVPVLKRSGDSLLAGSINSEQALTMRVSAVGAQLRIAAIDAVTRQAQNWKPRLAQLADRLASGFVVAILLLAALTYAGWHWLDPQRAFWIALSVLVVSCPCALSLATPLALTNATNTLRRRGLLVTRADAWEQLPTITDVVFDKTGTLSEGCISIAAIEPCGARSAAICRDLAAALEIGSNHPIAAAFAAEYVLAAGERRQYATGKTGGGVEGIVGGRRYRLGDAAFALQLSGLNESQLSDTQLMNPEQRAGHWILLADHRGPVCWFRLQDRLRSDAASTLAALRERGLQLHLLSGDSSGSAAELAAQLGIEHALSGATPEQKLLYVQQLQRAGKRVLMVGDGINDIPVLAAADVSMAMHAASQLAKSNADCLLLSARLDRILLLLDVGTQTRRIVRENLAWALLYNAVAIPLAALGWVAPWLAAAGMSLSSLLVTVNALRLQYNGKPQPH
ncbi:MAG TPA: heavy metal translocating P-type ATPase [Spongiibacteraceae bacterium]|nr:heavy metal translocating P-type ATPase [Spongiibacteraceae bacterium]